MTAPDAAEVAARWSARAQRYHRWGDLAHGRPAYRRAWTSAFTELIGPPCKRIADVGTGTGEVAQLLVRMGHVVTGFDIADGMLAVARSKPGVRAVRGDAYDLPLCDSSVDVVVNRMVFWTLHEPERALREWCRVLAPGGRIVVVDGLHFTRGDGSLARLSRLREQAFWAAHDRIDRHRSGTVDRRGGYRADPVPPPGLSWTGAHDAARHFAAAGLSGVAVGRLTEVARVHRRTAPVRWRLAGLLPEFFTLTWQRP